MQLVRIYAEPEEIEERLRPFLATREEWLSVVEQVVAARANVISVDAVGAAGQQAYLAGIRHTRLMLLSKGYEPDWDEGIESAVHPGLSIKILYQSVDQCCLPERGPKALNKKGEASERIFEKTLFPPGSLPEAARKGDVTNESGWCLCVAVNDDDVTAELSRPDSLEGKNFKLYIERIFLIRPGEWKPKKVEIAPPSDDYEFEISRK